jgi:hypothetical protein
VVGQLHYFNVLWEGAGSASLRPPPMALVRPSGAVRVVRSRPRSRRKV